MIPRDDSSQRRSNRDRIIGGPTRRNRMTEMLSRPPASLASRTNSSTLALRICGLSVMFKIKDVELCATPQTEDHNDPPQADLIPVSQEAPFLKLSVDLYTVGRILILDAPLPRIINELGVLR